MSEANETSTVRNRQLPAIDEIEAFSEEDKACMLEIRNVLAQYNRLDRFGVCLLHDHFEMNEGEILLETSDAENRTLTLRPVEESQLTPENIIETSWRLASGGDELPITACRRACLSGPGGHRQSHENLPDV